MPMPPDVLAALAVVVDRPDFFGLEKDSARKLWIVGLYNGRTRDGDRLITWSEGGRLSEVLAHVQAKPVVKVTP